MPGGITWTEARTQAAVRSFQGRPGHLATATSEQENRFIAGTTPTNLWSYYLGAFRSAGGSDPAANWQWITGEPWNFTAWYPSYPNDPTSRDNALSVHGPQFPPALLASWSDLAASQLQPAYIVEYESPSIDAGLLAYYPFDGNANDVSGNGLDGTVHGATMTNDGMLRPAYAFNGTTSHITIADPDEKLSFDAKTDSYTVTAWLKMNTISSGHPFQQVIVDRGTIARAPVCMDLRYDEQAQRFLVLVWDGSTSPAVVNKSKPVAGAWYHLAMTVSNRTIRLFVNGVDETQPTAWEGVVPTTFGSTKNTDAIVNIGRWCGDGRCDSYFSGTIDTVRIYNRALSAIELTALYRLESGAARRTSLRGTVVGADAQGRALGPLAGSTVTLAGTRTAITDHRGEFEFLDLEAGALSVEAAKAGYHSITKSADVLPERAGRVDFQLTKQGGAGFPTAIDFASPNGRHFIEGMPGNLTFDTTVAWNGSPGTVRFNVGGTWHAGNVTDQGGGVARAKVSVPVPTLIPALRELTVEVANAEGRSYTLRPGVHFYPLPGLVVAWYGKAIPWEVAGVALTYSQELAWPIWDVEIPSGVLSSRAVLGIAGKLTFDPVAGSFTESRSGFGAYSQALEFAEIENLGDGRLDFTRSLELALGAGETTGLTAGWEVSLTGKAGVGAPAVLVLDLLVPGLGQGASKLPLIGDIKLRLYLIVGGSLAAEYASDEVANCWWGASSLSGSLTGGLEGQAVLEVDWLDSEAGVYVGATGTPEFGICPKWSFEGITLRGYAGYFVETPLLDWSQEVGLELRLEPGGNLSLLSPVRPTRLAHGGWRPIGNSRLHWGEANQVGHSRAARLASPTPNGEPDEVTVATNVVRLARPALETGGSDPVVLFTLHDPQKAWYAATDIGFLRGRGNSGWTMARIADDLAAESSPKAASADSNLMLATWTRVTGDISGATNPVQVAAHMDIVASWLDRRTGEWSESAQLTANDVVDRFPLPIFFGNQPGVLWVQNEGGHEVGNAASGDRLLFSEWSGGAWAEPQLLWSGQKGILGFGFAADGAGEGHLVFAVDENGTLETRTDRELYHTATVSGVWQPATRLTSDSVEDALPTLVAPNGVPTCVWSAGGQLVYTPLGAWAPKPVYAEQTLANEAATLDGVTLPGGAAVAYVVQGTNGIDIVASFYDAALDRWSLPRRLTFDEHAESALSLDFDGKDLVFAYLKTQTVRTNLNVEINGQMQHLENVPQPGRTDLCLLRHTLGNDLAVVPDSLLIEPANPEPGTSATLKATIENRGDLPVQGIQVAFYDGDPNQGGKPISTPQSSPEILIAGGKREVSVAWTMPAEPASHTVYIVVDPALAVEDRDRANNSASRLTVLPDLTVETGWSATVSATSVSVVARVLNTGVIPVGTVGVSWRLGAADGEEIGKSTIESLSAGGVNEAAYQWDTSARFFAQSFVTVYAVVDPTDAVQEVDETNNAYPQTVRVVPGWVPRIASIEVLPTGNARLLIQADGVEVADLAIQGTDSLKSPITWTEEPGIAVTSAAEGRFEAQVPVTVQSRFWRVRLLR